VFGLCHLLGYRVAPRIKDLKDHKLYTVEKPDTWPLLTPLIGDTVETAVIVAQWTEPTRFKVSIETGAVVPSVILRKLAAAGAGNVLSRALLRPDRADAVHPAMAIRPGTASAQPRGSKQGRGHQRATARSISFTVREKFETASSKIKASAH
jgi:hypothetical protein